MNSLIELEIEQPLSVFQMNFSDGDVELPIYNLDTYFNLIDLPFEMKSDAFRNRIRNSNIGCKEKNIHSTEIQKGIFQYIIVEHQKKSENELFLYHAKIMINYEIDQIVIPLLHSHKSFFSSRKQTIEWKSISSGISPMTNKTVENICMEAIKVLKKKNIPKCLFHEQ